jgi:hypothetical protein
MPVDHAEAILKSMKDLDLALDSWHSYLDSKGIEEEFLASF